MKTRQIFDYIVRQELIAALIEGGFKPKKAGKIVSERHRAAVKEGAIEILEKVTALLKEDRFDEIAGMLASSPSGDGYGCDNDYIDFSSLDQTDCSNKFDKEFSDISTVISFLECKNY